MCGKRYTDECFMVQARVAELVDAPDSKSGASDGVRVQVPPLAPTFKLKLKNKPQTYANLIIKNIGFDGASTCKVCINGCVGDSVLSECPPRVC